VNRNRASATFAFALALAGLLAPAAGAAPVHVGEAVDVAAATPIGDILAAPADYVGKVVRVEGEVSGVCQHMGCWMDVGDEQGRRIRIKVEDGVIVFPGDAVGKPAVAQGTVTVEEMTREQWIAWNEHLAAEGGAPFDAAAVGTGPFKLVQIAGTGADIGDGSGGE
jgi:hypothetical protein